MTESEEIKKQDKITSVRPFVFAAPEIKQAVENLSIYWQLSNQKSIALYEKWEKPQVIKGVTYYFKGSLHEASLLDEFRDLAELSFGKPWQTLVQAIMYTNATDNEVSLDGFYKLSKEYQTQIMEIITKGQAAKDFLVEWLKPLNKKDVFEAIYDAAKITLGNGRYDKFNILKIDSIKSKPNEDDSVTIFPEILEIDNSFALVDYLRSYPDLHDCLILTFMRNKKYDFKTTIYMFLVWRESLYAIEMSDHRANLENSAGARNPSRYLERFDDVWLPLDKMLGSKRNNEKNEIVVRNQKVFRRGNMYDIIEKKPTTAAWLEIFIYRIIDFLKNNKKIPQAMTVTQGLKMLEDKSTGIETRVKIKDGYESFESQNDASSYLIKKFENDITAIVPAQIHLPDVMGTKEYVESVIKYKQRTILAENLKKLLWKDYNQNSKRVYKEIRKFVLSQDMSKIVKKALLDKKYPRMYYLTDFGMDSDKVWIDGKQVKLGKPKILEAKILSVINYSEDQKEYNTNRRNRRFRSDYVSPDRFGSTMGFSYNEDDLEIICTEDRLFFDYERPPYGGKRFGKPCIICKKFRWNMLVSLQFEDYNQFMSFFDAKSEDVPKEMIDHFHHQNESYVGNSILDDTDPVDEIKDPWFRTVHKRMYSPYEKYPEGEPYLNVRIPICNTCYKDLKPIEK